MNTEKIQNQINGNIMIVDDVPANLKILGEILKLEGYKVRPVPNGNLALQVIEKEIPDLILLDIMMPEMDGYEVCRRLRENPVFADIPVIFISALNDSQNIVKALKVGGVDYVTKPFKAEEVLARVATHLKINQQQKELQKLNDEKDKLFSIISHDLRGPLGGFMSYTELMIDESMEFSEADLKEMAMELNVSSKNIYNLLDNLLNWAKLQRNQFVIEKNTFKLAKLLNDELNAIAELAKNKSISLKIDIADDILVDTDKNMLLTIIRNLSSNAVKFTPSGGNITIKSYFDTNEIIICVNDNGIGMSTEIIDNLFTINKKTNRLGTEGEASTGLGLILCKDFAEKLGGRIWVESEENTGSSFRFSIPYLFPVIVAEKPEVSLKKEILNSSLNNYRLKILIIEDDEISNKVIVNTLSDFNFDIYHVKSGIEALEVCRNNPDINLILMDIMLPGMDGYITTRKIREFNKDVIIFAQTVLTQKGEKEKALESGCNEHLPKPIDMNKLLELIKKYFFNIS